MQGTPKKYHLPKILVCTLLLLDTLVKLTVDAMTPKRDFYTSKHLRNQDGQNPIKALLCARRSSIKPQQPPDEVHSDPNILTFICNN